MERIVDMATDDRHLSAYGGFLVVHERSAEVGRILLDDIAAVIVHAHGITWTTSPPFDGAILFRNGRKHYRTSSSRERLRYSDRKLRSRS